MSVYAQAERRNAGLPYSYTFSRIESIFSLRISQVARSKAPGCDFTEIGVYEYVYEYGLVVQRR